MDWYARSQRPRASERSTTSRRTRHRRFIVSSVPSDPSGRICPSVGVPVSPVARRVWSARVAEREPLVAAHTEFVFCEQSIERTLAWLSKHRRLSVRYERRDDIHEAFLHLGCSLIRSEEHTS